MPLNVRELNRIEESILRNKTEVAKILERRSKATLSKDELASLRAWADASQKTLEGCEEISKYMEHFSRPIAHELKANQAATMRGLETVMKARDAKQFHRWMKSQFIPHVRISERMAHVAATSMYKTQGRDVDFHRWTGTREATSR